MRIRLIVPPVFQVCGVVAYYSVVMLLCARLKETVSVWTVTRHCLDCNQTLSGYSPNRLWGVFQPFADGLKFILTRTTIPSFAYGGVFLCVSVFFLGGSFCSLGGDSISKCI